MRTYKGIVSGGGKRASALGFPTANIPLQDGHEPGIYAACVRRAHSTYDGVAYADAVRGVLEIHLFDFSGELYGEEIEVELHKKLRDTMPFKTDTEARARIAADVEAARAYFDKMR